MAVDREKFNLESDWHGSEVNNKGDFSVNTGVLGFDLESDWHGSEVNDEGEFSVNTGVLGFDLESDWHGSEVNDECDLSVNTGVAVTSGREGGLDKADDFSISFTRFAGCSSLSSFSVNNVCINIKNQSIWNISNV